MDPTELKHLWILALTRRGDCPKCGMALEPRTSQAADPDNPELTDMRRRFRVCLALTAPVFVIAMRALLDLSPRDGPPHPTGWNRGGHRPRPEEPGSWGAARRSFHGVGR